MWARYPRTISTRSRSRIDTNVGKSWWPTSSGRRSISSFSSTTRTVLSGSPRPARAAIPTRQAQLERSRPSTPGRRCGAGAGAVH